MSDIALMDDELAELQTVTEVPQEAPKKLSRLRKGGSKPGKAVDAGIEVLADKTNCPTSPAHAASPKPAGATRQVASPAAAQLDPEDMNEAESPDQPLDGASPHPSHSSEEAHTAREDYWDSEDELEQEIAKGHASCGQPERSLSPAGQCSLS